MTNRAIPSGQAQSYYRLVLNDVLVAPKLGDSVYKRMLDPSLPALPAPVVPLTIADGAVNDFDIIGGDAVVAKRKAAPKPKFLGLDGAANG